MPFSMEGKEHRKALYDSRHSLIHDVCCLHAKATLIPPSPKSLSHHQPRQRVSFSSPQLTGAPHHPHTNTLSIAPLGSDLLATKKVTALVPPSTVRQGGSSPHLNTLLTNCSDGHYGSYSPRRLFQCRLPSLHSAPAQCAFQPHISRVPVGIAVHLIRCCKLPGWQAAVVAARRGGEQRGGGGEG